MDTMTESTDRLTQIALETVRAAYRRALRDAYNAVANLTDGDSERHDSAIVEACMAIEALKLPPELQ